MIVDGILVAYLFLVSGALLPPLLLPRGAGALDIENGLPALQWALAGVLLLIGVLFVHHFWLRDVAPVLRAAWLPICFSALALASSLWSTNPELTLRRAIALAGTTLVAMVLAGVLGYRRSVKLVTCLLAVIVVGSLASAIWFPDFGIHQTGSHVGDWKGLYVHKNLLGREMALAAGLLLMASIYAKGWAGRMVWLALTAASLLLVIQSGSATGSIAAIGGLLTALVSRAARGRPLIGSAFVTVGLIVLLLAAPTLTSEPEQALAVVNRDLSLTGRTQLWNQVLGKIGERPWLGHGYRGFWGSSGGAAISEALGWRVVHAHNSWLDVGLDLGVIGVLLIGALIAWPVLRNVLRRLPPSRLSETGRVVAVVVLLVAMSDSVMLGPNNLFLVMLFLQFIAGGLAHERSSQDAGSQHMAHSPLAGGMIASADE